MTDAVVMEAKGLGRILAGDPPIVLVKEASLAIERGKFTAIVGPSGCGKSSLLYLLGLMDRPTSGQLLMEGRDVTTLDGRALSAVRLEKLGFVFQFHFLLPEFTALQNVMMPMRRRGLLSRDQIEARAMQLLADIGLEGQEHKTPDRMSGGERQRVAVARALSNDPVLVLGDEPTGNLDSANSERVVDIFRLLAHQQRRAVVCVTHDMGIAAQADIRVRMLDGRIVGVDRQ